jgi:hypothetical protein
MAEKAIHQIVAESVIGKASTSGLKLDGKSSYTIITDAAGWIARVTPKVAEFNKKRFEGAALAAAGLDREGKDEFHRLHYAGRKLAALSAASAEGATEEVKLEAEKVPTSPGVDELAKAVDAAKPLPKKEAKPKATKSSKAKGTSKTKSTKGGGKGKAKEAAGK